MKKLILKSREERRIENGHLWIFSNEINGAQSPLKGFQPGEQVLIESSRGKLLGCGYVNPNSLICARLVTRDGSPLDYSLLSKRLQDALHLREKIFDEPFYRMVYGESDLLPGLVVDRFGSHLSVQINSSGMEVLTETILDCLKSLLNPESILLKNNSSIRKLEGLPQKVEVVFGSPPDLVELKENGIPLLAPLKSGQKTGWFYDQRVNRNMLKKYVGGKRVLDVFSYVGGFAVQAGAFGAREIWAIDASRKALEIAEQNAEINGLKDIFTGAEGDCFHVLKTLREEQEFFDVIVVDPPAFIKRKKDHQEGLRAYQRVNNLAVRLLKPGGILLSATCSMHLKRDELLDVLRYCSQRQQRHVQVLAEGSQGPDHPIHPAIAETRYLKAFLAHIT